VCLHGAFAFSFERSPGRRSEKANRLKIKNGPTFSKKRCFRKSGAKPHFRAFFSQKEKKGTFGVSFAKKEKIWKIMKKGQVFTKEDFSCQTRRPST
jgi:hypothetical protein